MNKKNIPIHKTYLIMILISAIISLITIIYLKVITTNGIILKEDLTTNFRDEVYINDFISYIDGKLTNNYKVDTSIVGTNELKITFKNKYGIIVNKNISIEVKDITSPTIIVKNPYTIYKGEIDNLVDTIFCADDYDDYITCTIEGEYNLNEVGRYDLKITAIDNSGNSTSKDFTLNVIERTNTNNSSSNNTSYISFKSILNKYKNENTLVGLDISKWQGEVDYTKLKTEGIDFVMLKIGGQTKIDGEFILDPKFYDNIEKATQNDIKVGLYFYSYARSIKEAREQADFIVKHLKDYEINMPIAFDWENWNKFTTFHLSFNTLNNIAHAFIDRVDELGYTGILYSCKYYLENIWYSDEYTNWLAYYNTSFNDYKDYYMWQLCSDGKIDGIDGYVDIDIMHVENANN